jgi:hypothetical protein
VKANTSGRNDEPVVVILLFIGSSHVNAKIGSVTYDSGDAARLGKTVKHGEYWVALLGEKLPMWERPLQRLHGPLNPATLNRLLGGACAGSVDFADWSDQLGLNLGEEVFDIPVQVEEEALKS